MTDVYRCIIITAADALLVRSIADMFAGSAVSAGNISATEQYIANKTGIAL